MFNNFSVISHNMVVKVWEVLCLTFKNYACSTLEDFIQSRLSQTDSEHLLEGPFQWSIFHCAQSGDLISFLGSSWTDWMLELLLERHCCNPAKKKWQQLENIVFRKNLMSMNNKTPGRPLTQAGRTTFCRTPAETKISSLCCFVHTGI